MYEKGAGTTITAPQGWKLIRTTNQGNQVGMATFYKVAGNNEPSTYAFTMSNSPKWNIGISRIEYADALNPIVDHSGASGSKSLTATAPSLTTTACNTLVLTFFTNKTDATWTNAAGLTEVYDVPNTQQGLTSNMMAYYIQPNAGNTGDKTATSSKSEDWVAQQIAIKTDSHKSDEDSRMNSLTAVNENQLNKEQGVMSLMAYPNPIVDRIYIQFSEIAKEPVPYAINIFDQIGRSYPVNALWNSENSSLEIDFTIMSKGFYIIRVSTNTGIQALKVQKK